MQALFKWQDLFTFTARITKGLRERRSPRYCHYLVLTVLSLTGLVGASAAHAIDWEDPYAVWGARVPVGMPDNDIQQCSDDGEPHDFFYIFNVELNDLWWGQCPWCASVGITTRRESNHKIVSPTLATRSFTIDTRAMDPNRSGSGTDEYSGKPEHFHGTHSEFLAYLNSEEFRVGFIYYPNQVYIQGMPGKFESPEPDIPAALAQGHIAHRRFSYFEASASVIARTFDCEDIAEEDFCPSGDCPTGGNGTGLGDDPMGNGGDTPNNAPLNRDEPPPAGDGCDSGDTGSPRIGNNPVLASGAKHFTEQCLNTSYKDSNIVVGLSYDSRWADLPVQRSFGQLGKGWTRSHTQGLALGNAPAEILYIDTAGVEYPFVPSAEGSQWLAQGVGPTEARVSMVQNGQQWLLTYENGNTETFNNNGQLVSVCTAQTQVCRDYEYSSVEESGVNYQVQTIHLRDVNSTQVQQSTELLVRESDLRLVMVRDATQELPVQDRRVVSLNYDANGQLISITRPDGAKTSYEYDANGYVIARIDANMQSDSGSPNAGWRHEIEYEAADSHRIDTPLRRVTAQHWKNAAGELQFSEQFYYEGNIARVETLGYETGSASVARTNRFELDEKGRVIKAFAPNSNSVFTAYIYCDAAAEPVHCPSSQSDENLRRIIMPDGETIEYSYDTKGHVLSTSRLPGESVVTTQN